MLQSLFPDASYEWLRAKSAGKGIERMLLIADRCPKPEKNPPPTLREPHAGWLVLAGQRKSGLVHCSLLLFRTSSFLRVVICGTNLDGQLDRDRDSLFVQVCCACACIESRRLRPRMRCSVVHWQDFPAVAGATPSRNSAHFGGRLEKFLAYLPYEGLPAEDMRRVRDHCGSVISGVDFSGATGALVTCMPGGSKGEDKGGWKQLRQALAEIQAPRTDGPVHIATGHYGAIKTPFLAKMTGVLRRIPDQDLSKASTNDQLFRLIGRCFLYHPSRRTTLAPQTNSFAVLRTTAPGAASDAKVLDRYFHDSLPKFCRATLGELTPMLHGKAMLATSADGSKGVMFVGSQNFSEASFGKDEGRQPTNVEIGVIIKADDADAVGELEARFPVQLAPMEAFGTPAHDRGYVMARGPTDGDNTMHGLQMRWRMRCNDLGYLAQWRAFLHRFWHICSRCGCVTGDTVHGGRVSPTAIAAMENAALEPHLCGTCQ
jgi:hypothetical protein